MNLIYMAKPSYGGWVSFTAHLSLKYNYKLYKVGNRTEKLKSGEPRLRKFGYGVYYQNISIEDALALDNVLITAIDKKYYKYLHQFSEKTKLVIHDPTEVKGKSCKAVLDNLNRFTVITIRMSVKDFLQTKYNIDSEFKPHPFYEYERTIVPKKNRQGAVSISRIDFDKHTDISLMANKLLSKKLKIDIYGATNDRYVYFKLRGDEMEFDKYYKGTFEKSFVELDKILSPKKFVVDLSAIKNDGGGSQYTFLEAIYQDCVLILNKKWLDTGKTIFSNKHNCITVENENDIFRVIAEDRALKLNFNKIIKNARLLLKPHIDVKW